MTLRLSAARNSGPLLAAQAGFREILQFSQIRLWTAPSMRSVQLALNSLDRCFQWPDRRQFLLDPV
jgi:hypothetical protein